MTTRGAKYGNEGFLRSLFSVKKEVKTRKIFVNLNRNSSDSKRDNFCMSNNKYQIEYRISVIAHTVFIFKNKTTRL